MKTAGTPVTPERLNRLHGRPPLASTVETRLRALQDPGDADLSIGQAFASLHSQEARKALKYIDDIRSGKLVSEVENRNHMLQLFEKGLLTQEELREAFGMTPQPDLGNRSKGGFGGSQGDEPGAVSRTKSIDQQFLELDGKVDKILELVTPNAEVEKPRPTRCSPRTTPSPPGRPSSAPKIANRKASPTILDALRKISEGCADRLLEYLNRR